VCQPVESNLITSQATHGILKERDRRMTNTSHCDEMGDRVTLGVTASFCAEHALMGGGKVVSGGDEVVSRRMWSQNRCRPKMCMFECERARVSVHVRAHAHSHDRHAYTHAQTNTHAHIQVAAEADAGAHLCI
jgi:hypothetical protein